MRVVVYLEWPEACFRATDGDLRYLKKLLPAGAKAVRVRSEAALLAALPAATHVITWYFKAEWYRLAPKLVWVATPAAGRELVARADVPCHFGHYHGEIMAESVAAFCLAWSRGFLWKKPDAWPRTWMGDRCRMLAGSVAVIAGFGHVGRAVGAKLEALGVRVRGLTHRECDALRRSRVRRPAVLGSADWFVMALPSDTGTDGFLDAALIAKLPRKCVVVNIGRGNAVDERALAAALREGRLAGAYLDVLRHEPHCRQALGFGEDVRRPGGEFLVGKVPNAVVMPHASAFSADYVQRCFKELKDDGVI